jgi:hypothetical protein
MALGVICGALTGLLYAASNILLGYFLIPENGEALSALQLLAWIAPTALWWMFLFMILAVISAFLVETRPVKHPASSSS